MIEQFWDAYAEVLTLGDGAELADELVAEVVAGRMRATARLLRELVSSGHPIPKQGGLSILVDGESRPRCIVRTVEVDMKPLYSVDSRFAWDQGGGDRSLTWWLSAHTRYFRRQAARDGFTLDDNTVVLLQRFVVVWPPSFADSAEVL